MHKPLSHSSNKHPHLQPESSQFVTTIHKRADSLAFSLTSEKNTCPNESIKINLPSYEQSKQDTLNFQLQYLQKKKKSGHSKTKKIVNQNNKIAKSLSKLTQQSTLEYFKIKKQPTKCSQNSFPQNRIGKIIKRDGTPLNYKSFAKSKPKHKDKPKICSILDKNNQFSNQNIQKILKNRELDRLTKQLQTVRNSLQKSQKSKSQCSLQLSTTKSILKQLKQQQRNHDKIIKSLQFALKKSQTIRNKQKDIIMGQKYELQKYQQIIKRNRLIR